MRDFMMTEFDKSVEFNRIQKYLYAEHNDVMQGLKDKSLAEQVFFIIEGVMKKAREYNAIEDYLIAEKLIRLDLEGTMTKGLDEIVIEMIDGLMKRTSGYITEGGDARFTPHRFVRFPLPHRPVITGMSGDKDGQISLKFDGEDECVSIDEARKDSRFPDFIRNNPPPEQIAEVTRLIMGFDPAKPGSEHSVLLKQDGEGNTILLERKGVTYRHTVDFTDPTGPKFSTEKVKKKLPTVWERMWAYLEKWIKEH